MRNDRFNKEKIFYCVLLVFVVVGCALLVRVCPVKSMNFSSQDDVISLPVSSSKPVSLSILYSVVTDFVELFEAKGICNLQK